MAISCGNRLASFSATLGRPTKLATCQSVIDFFLQTGLYNIMEWILEVVVKLL